MKSIHTFQKCRQKCLHCSLDVDFWCILILKLVTNRSCFLIFSVSQAFKMKTTSSLLHVILKACFLMDHPFFCTCNSFPGWIFYWFFVAVIILYIFLIFLFCVSCILFKLFLNNLRLFSIPMRQQKQHSLKRTIILKEKG